MLNCITCGNTLTGKQTKYCSRKCLQNSTNVKHNNYEKQKERGLANKNKLLDLKGKFCHICGYNKNTSALCFHHLHDKSFGIDIRKCSNTNWEKLVEEVNKCIVLCHNCHMEEHYPEHMVRPAGFEPAINKL